MTHDWLSSMFKTPRHEPEIEKIEIDWSSFNSEFDQRLDDAIQAMTKGRVHTAFEAPTYDSMLETMTIHSQVMAEIKKRQLEDQRMIEGVAKEAFRLGVGMLIATRDGWVVLAEASELVPARTAYWMDHNALEAFTDRALETLADDPPILWFDDNID